MQVEGKRVLVVGLGRSGRAAARLLADRGAHVIGNDHRSEIENPSELESVGVRLELGHHDQQLFESVDRIVVSPGVPPLPSLDAAEAAGVPIVSELELASSFVKGTLVAVTGTNGKSTVTSLLGAMAERDPRPAFVGGNLGTPLVEVVGSPAAEQGGLVVVEVSSFQLERVIDFRPHVALLLNVSEDHLDRYENYADYVAAKGRIAARQTSSDHVVVPASDEVCSALARTGSAQVHAFGKGGEVFASDGLLRDSVSGLEVPIDALGIRGGHNVRNALAAMLAGRLAGIAPATVCAGLTSLRGLPHRMQSVGAFDDVRWYDDSKATNVGAAVAALRGFEGDAGKVVLIAGGKHKGSGYEPLLEVLRDVGRAVVTLGEAAELIEETLGATIVWERASSLSDAVVRASSFARPGDVVLLAPACSSYDMFRSYTERGEVFQSAVRALHEGDA